MLPLYHDLDGRTVVIVGGGSVAARRARKLAREADVTVVAPEFDDRFEGIPCETVERRVQPEDAADLVADAFLVVAATDDHSLNDAVADAARNAGCLVNRADETADVVMPSLAESERLSVAISTGGASPAVCRYLRQEIDPILNRTDPMVDLQADLREALRERNHLFEDRRAALRAVLDSDEVWVALEAGKAERARERAWAVVDETIEN
ncbi:MAG: precorrin-2 dehydrogenase/sirohydrochlorin ferrochelatase [Halobacteriales archaeon]|jgi:precorrin-2 dehydrogenase/sirohydrochlorin ferrochelatase